MDDLIVVILTLVVAGFGLLGQLKKKKRASSGNDNQKTPESFWDLIMGNAEDQGQVAVSEYDESDLEYASESGEQQFEEGIVKTKFQPSSTRKAQAVSENIETLKTTNPKLKSKIKTEFSLRKAVIYSEILNRKYT